MILGYSSVIPRKRFRVSELCILEQREGAGRGRSDKGNSRV